MDHSKALGLLVQKSDHSSGQVVNEWSINGLKWSGVVWTKFLNKKAITRYNSVKKSTLTDLV